jgi:hypothetical protein
MLQLTGQALPALTPDPTVIFDPHKCHEVDRKWCRDKGFRPNRLWVDTETDTYFLQTTGRVVDRRPGFWEQDEDDGFDRYRVVWQLNSKAFDLLNGMVLPCFVVVGQLLIPVSDDLRIELELAYPRTGRYGEFYWLNRDGTVSGEFHTINYYGLPLLPLPLMLPSRLPRLTASTDARVPEPTPVG